MNIFNLLTWTSLKQQILHRQRSSGLFSDTLRSSIMLFTLRSLRITILYRIASEFQWHYQLVKDVNWRYWEVVLIIIFNEKNISRARLSRRWNQRTVLNEADTFLSRESQRWSCKMKTLIRVVLTSSKVLSTISSKNSILVWMIIMMSGSVRFSHWIIIVPKWIVILTDSRRRLILIWINIMFVVIDIMRDKILFFELSVYSFYDRHRTLFWANRSISFCSSKKDESV